MNRQAKIAALQARVAAEQTLPDQAYELMEQAVRLYARAETDPDDIREDLEVIIRDVKDKIAVINRAHDEALFAEHQLHDMLARKYEENIRNA